LEVIEPALPIIARKHIKVAVNAGASDPQLLAETLRELVNNQKLDLKVAWVDGDDVIEQVSGKLANNDIQLQNIDTGEKISDWEFKPVAAQAYLGAFGVAEAFRSGADLVICGRVADASTCMGGAIWWHGWDRKNLSALAASLIAGHLIECSTYITGANFSGFKNIPRTDALGLPIAEIASDGSVRITKTEGSGGAVTSETVKAQLLYEIQGPWYVFSNSSVGSEVNFEQVFQFRCYCRN